MALMLSKLYDALIAAGAPDDRARAAAEEGAVYESRFATIEKHLATLDVKLTAIDGKLALIIWAVGINAAATITMLVKHW